MPFTYGFYDSLNHDRRYNSEQFSTLIDLLITEGVFTTYLEQFMTVASSPYSMNVVVKPGFAWFAKSWTESTDNVSLAIPPSSAVYDRIDVVCLEMNRTQTVRRNYLKLITGTPASAPVPQTLQNTSLVKQVPLAYVRVPKNATSINSANITIKVGTSDCPFVTGLLQQATLDDIYAEWRYEFDVWFLREKAEMEELIAGMPQKFEDFLTGAKIQIDNTIRQINVQFNDSLDEWKTEFDTWFGSIQTALEGDVAANLARGIADNRADIEKIKNELPKKVNVSDKATSTDVAAGTANKWVDSATLKAEISTYITEFLSASYPG